RAKSHHDAGGMGLLLAKRSLQPQWLDPADRHLWQRTASIQPCIQRAAGGSAIITWNGVIKRVGQRSVSRELRLQQARLCAQRIAKRMEHCTGGRRGIGRSADTIEPG